MSIEPLKPVLCDARLGEGGGYAEETGEKQEQMPVDGADHVARRHAAGQEEDPGDGESGKLARQMREEQDDERHHRSSAAQDLEPVDRFMAERFFGESRRRLE